MVESSESHWLKMLFNNEATGLELGKSTTLCAPLFISIPCTGKAQDSSHSSSRGSTKLFTLPRCTDHIRIPLCMTYAVACPRTLSFFSSKGCGSPTYVCVCVSVCYHLISTTTRLCYILKIKQKAAAKNARKYKPIVLKLFCCKDIII